MTDAPNTARTEGDARYCKLCGQALELCEQLQQRDNIRCCYSCFHPLAANDNRVAELEADLFRLAGPPCEHPPCGGKRAIEHRLCGCFGSMHLMSRDEANHPVDVDRHPPAPAIEAWLRERAR